MNNIEADAKTKIFEAIGEASMCWTPRPEGTFDSTHASAVANNLFKYLKDAGVFEPK